MNKDFSSARRRILKSATATSIIGLTALTSACSSRNIPYVAKESGFDQISPLFYWSDLMLQATRDLELTPITASRVYALAHLSGSLAVGNQHSLHRDLGASQPTNINHELAFGVAFSLACEEGLGRSMSVERRRFIRSFDVANKQESIVWATKVARTVISARTRDGAQDSKSLFYPSQYTKRDDALAWSPIGPFYNSKIGPSYKSFERGLRPGWGAQKPWVIQSVNQYNAEPFPSIGSAEFKRQVEKIKYLGAANSNTRTDEQTEIAFFWEDGPRGISINGHLQLLTLQLLAQRQFTFQQQSKILACLSIAQADAGIVAWHNKYREDIIRPETVIRFADSRFPSTNLSSLKDANWLSLLPTPRFPSYVSGHSTFGAVWSEIMSLMLGSDKISLTGTTPDLINWPLLEGVTRSWQSLRAIAEENGISREYGGVHWESDNIEGLRLGYRIANDIYKHDYLGAA